LSTFDDEKPFGRFFMHVGIHVQLLGRASGLAAAQVGRMLSRSPITRRSRRRRTTISTLTQLHDVDRAITRRTRRHYGRLTTSERRQKLRQRLTRPLWSRLIPQSGLRHAAARHQRPRQGQAPTANRYPRRLTHSAQVRAQSTA